MSRNRWRRLFSFFLLAGMILGFVQPAGAIGAAQVSKPLSAPVSQEEVLAKIEPLVQQEIAQNGSTDFFVWMKEKADLSPAQNLKTKLEKGTFVFNTLQDFSNRTQKDLRAYLDQQGADYRAYYIANKILVRGGDENLLNTIAARSDVAQIKANHHFKVEPIKSEAPQVDKTLAVEPNISFVGADDVWALGYTGQGIVVADNDTGVDETHPALKTHYRGCLNPPDCTSWDYNYNWWDATGTYPTNPNDGNGHGTHTAGTIVGDDGAGNQIGMAPGAQMINCKLLDDTGSGTDAMVTECFEWDLAPWDLNGVNPDPTKAPNVTNNSWGYGGGGYNIFEDEIANMQAAGILMEFSAGNDGPGCQTLGSPGDYLQVLTTGSVSHTAAYPGNLTGFSSRGPSILYPSDFFPDVMAPGENIRSSWPGGGYVYLSGTSMSSPHVAGLVALLWSAVPSLIGQVDLTDQLISNTAVPLTGQNGSNCGGDHTNGPNNDWGNGTINSYDAVLAGQGGETGFLDGYVTDAVNGDPIEGASVNANPQGLGPGINAITDPQGYYTMTLFTGIYDVTAAKYGYDTVTVNGVEIIANITTHQDFQLTPGSVWLPGADTAPLFDWYRYDCVWFDDGTGPSDYNQKAYCPGGRSISPTIEQPNIEKYDPLTDSWSDSGYDVNEDVSNYTANLVYDDGTGRGPAIYIIGGYNADGAVPGNIGTIQRFYPKTGDVESLPAADNWNVTVSGNLTGAMGNAVVNDIIYVFGGWENVAGPPYFYAGTWAFDPKQPSGSRWTDLGVSLSQARSYIQVASQGGKIYAMGGVSDYVGGDLVPSTTVEVLDTADVGAGWTQLASLPVASGEGRGFGFDVDTLGYNAPWTGKLYVVGGGDWSSNTTEVMEYDIATDTWNQGFPDLQYPRRDNAGFFIPLCTDDPSDNMPAMMTTGGWWTGDAPPFAPTEYYPFSCTGPTPEPDIAVNPSSLSAELYPDTTMQATLTISNTGDAPLNWNLSEAEGMILSGQTVKSGGEPSRKVTLGSVAAPQGSVQAGEWKPNGPVELALDDGSAENAIGIGGTWEFIFLNRFTPDAADFPLVITDVSVYFPSFGLVQIGDNFELALYENTSGNTDPAVGSNFLASVPVTAQSLDEWDTYTLPEPVTFAGPGDVLVGVVALETPGTSYWPAAEDTTSSQQRSWAGWWLTTPPPEPPVLPPDDTWGLIDDFGFPGNWLIRASGSTVEAVDIPWLSETPTSGTVAPGAAQQVEVTFDATGLAVGVYTAGLKIDSNDPDTPQVTVPVTLTVITRGVNLEPPSLAGSGLPGETVDYTLTVNNTGSVDDDYDLTVEGNVWTTVVTPDSVHVPAMGNVDVTVQVTIPVEAFGAATDTANVIATSQADANKTDTSSVTTSVVEVYGVMLTPETAAQSGAPGDVVTYTLTVMNHGNVEDTFDLTALSNWPLNFSETSVTLMPGESADVVVSVTIPSDADNGAFDVATITATSQGDPTQTDTSELTTTAEVEVYYVYLPIIIKR